MGRPRKRARNDEEAEGSAAPAAGSAAAGKTTLFSELPDRSIDLSALSEPMPSPSLTFFDFLGIGDNSGFDIIPSHQQYQQQPQRKQNVIQLNDRLPPPVPTTRVPELRPSVTTNQPHSASATNRQDKFFSRSLFSINFGDIDFDPNVNDIDVNGVRTPPVRNKNSSSSQAASPSGESGISSLLDGSRNRRRNSQEARSSQMPATPGNNSYEGQRRRPTADNSPSSPKNTQESVSEASEDTTTTEVEQQQPPGSSPVSVSEGRHTLLGGIPTSSPIESFKKSSAAWLLTASYRVCSCEARLYLALESLQHLPTELTPALAVARAAAHTAHDTILCRNCSPPETIDLRKRPPPQSYQNLMILGSLLPLMAQTYRRIVTMVDKEAARASLRKIRLPFSLNEYGGVWGSMARWDSMCGQAPSMITRMVEPPLWRLGIRAMLKMDVYGIHPNGDDAGGESEVATPVVSSAESNAPASRDGKDDDQALNSENKATGVPKPGLFLTPIHFGLKDIAKMMEERAKMQQLYVDAANDAGLTQANEDRDGSHQAPPSAEKQKCQRVVELAKQEIDRLIIV